MQFNFCGIYISWISILADFVFLNLRMLAIVLCISIDVYNFVDETFVDGCSSVTTTNIKPRKN